LKRRQLETLKLRTFVFSGKIQWMAPREKIETNGWPSTSRRKRKKNRMLLKKVMNPNAFYQHEGEMIFEEKTTFSVI